MSESMIRISSLQKRSRSERLRQDSLIQEISPTLLEISTVYEKLKKGRDNQVFRLSKFGVGPEQEYKFTPQLVTGDAETIPLVPTFPGKLPEKQSSRFLDFEKFAGIPIQKYLFFSAATNLIQSDTLEGLISPDVESLDNYTDLLKTEYYWLNITDPNEADLSVLFNSFNIYDFTLNDIRETNSAEQIEFYQHYSFMSTRLLREVKIQEAGDVGGTEYFPDSDRQTPFETPGMDEPPHGRNSTGTGTSEMTVDMDFNILLFKNFVITMHDKKWTSINDILGFLNLVCRETLLTPDWILYSIFIELAQDAQYLLARIEPRLNEHRIGKISNLNEMSRVLHENYEMEVQLYAIERFLKPKIGVLRTIKFKSGRRFGKLLLGFLNDIREDFMEMNTDLKNLYHMLERSQDTFIALVSVEKSREANEMAQVMKRISQIALILLPIQTISGLFGMNVVVPWQHEESVLYFWILVMISGSVAALMYFSRSFLLQQMSLGNKDPAKKMFNCCKKRPQIQQPPV